MSDLTGGSGESESCPSLLETLQSPRPSDLSLKAEVNVCYLKWNICMNNRGIIG